MLVQRTQHAHQVTAAALYSLLTQVYDQFKQTETLKKFFHLVTGAKERHKPHHNSISGT